MSYVRVGILGSMSGGEVWSINPVFDPTGEFPGGVDQTALDAAATAIANLSPGASLLPYLSTALSITGARLEVRDDVTDALIGISIATRSTELPGTGSPHMPAQAAHVVSLRTNTPGGSGRGRLYWPACGTVISSSLRFAAPGPQNLSDAFATYLHAMETALVTAFPTIGFDLAVRSKTTKTTPHVVRLQCGDVIDTQRRRRDALPESYSSTAF